MARRKLYRWQFYDDSGTRQFMTVLARTQREACSFAVDLEREGKVWEPFPWTCFYFSRV